ncbi:hypothetical protein FOXYSP1_16708 [Fusarium oxysporum f. sp. phaseoli]
MHPGPLTTVSQADAVAKWYSGLTCANSHSPSIPSDLESRAIKPLLFYSWCNSQFRQGQGIQYCTHH